MYFQVIFDQELLKQISGRSDALNSLVIGEMRVFRITFSKLGQSLALWVKQLRFADFTQSRSSWRKLFRRKRSFTVEQLSESAIRLFNNFHYYSFFSNFVNLILDKKKKKIRNSLHSGGWKGHQPEPWTELQVLLRYIHGINIVPISAASTEIERSLKRYPNRQLMLNCLNIARTLHQLESSRTPYHWVQRMKLRWLS